MNSQYNKEDWKVSAMLRLLLKSDLKAHFFLTTTENNCEAMETQ